MTGEVPTFGEDYRLVWSECHKRRIATISNYTLDGTGRRVIPVLCDEELLKLSRLRFVAVTWDESGPKIVAGQAFLRLAQPVRDAVLWHEVGHIHHEHHLQLQQLTHDDLKKLRNAAVASGEVLLCEVEADSFAVARVGKIDFIRALKHLLRTRPMGQGDESGKDELMLRINKVEKM